MKSVGLRNLIFTLILSVVSVAAPIAPVPAVQAQSAPPSVETSLPSAAPSPTLSGQDSAGQYPGLLTIEHSAANAIVIDSSRGRTLYGKAVNDRLVLPAANKMMTALIAAEKLAPDTKVTISKVAAGIGYKEATGDGVDLRTGDKYSAEYLLLRLLFYDSNAAAVALAEQIASEEPEFVKLMNARAITYGMTATRFATASGEPLVLSVPAGGTVTNEQNLAIAQYTTVKDTATLVQMALSNEKFSRLFKKSNEYIVLDGMTLVPMANRLSHLWPYSEGRVTGAFLSQADQADSITIGTINGFGIITITANGNPSRVIGDVLSLYDDCQRTYESTPLVTAGETFTGAQEKTLDGEVFGLVYQKTINYIHPIGDLYLRTPVQYTSYGPFSRPIQRTMTVGQVIFVLQDGTRIAADVAPDRQILSSISMVDRVLTQLQVNRNLSFLLVSLIALLGLAIIGQAVFLALRLKRRHSGNPRQSTETRKPLL